MFRPAIQKTRVLAAIALINLLFFYWATQMRVEVKARGYNEKYLAAEKMADALAVLKQVRMEKGIFMDSENDPNETGLIGQPFGLITTDEGNLDAKLTTLNPNFAAGFIDLFLEAGIKPGDRVAAALTGSMPGANIAFYSACEALQIEPVIITSVGASQWGATDPYFTWLDMEQTLIDSGIFTFKSIAASIGGGGDRGKGLSLRGRELLWEAIYRNNIALVQEENLSSSIEKRMELYTAVLAAEPLAAFINIGGGAASIGAGINARLISAGLVQPFELYGISGNSVIKRFSELNIPLIQILNIQELTSALGLAFAPIPTPEIGAGIQYSEERYNLGVVIIALLMTLSIVITLGLYSHKQINDRMDSFEPESII